ncbi:hypothetical protein [Leeuwenhoekiella marinoflava]|uniref:Uncharacterized protein n=2 Tax=Leeuwenhoekiella marinoflava TaxID=988 RepID=A0A4Q0P3Y5_9FLAO|nr:hypothetical protein [Leeuwenhoekiella marinoflava]RXG21253.1 hypothetical protein DSL99_4058 [Leeuwenhoekiella marinoflava]SHG04825.1 hypothetical protein SAMN02745246_04063 [Leeuwenhoekiella marinoflava DSM 3653]
MKAFNLFIFLLPLLSFSQIKVLDHSKAELIGEIEQMGISTFKCLKVDSIYTIEFYNNKDKDIISYASFSFKNENDAFNQIYNLIIAGLEKKQSSETVLEAGNGKIKLEFIKNVMGSYFRLAQFNKEGTDIKAYSLTMNKKQVEKLFGK